MSDTLKERIYQDIKTAMREKDKPRLGTLRLISAAIKQKEVDERIEVDEPQLIAILDKMAKQRNESIAQYQKADRQDLIEVEQYELSVLSEYLPEQLAEAEIAALISQAIDETGATEMKDMGKVMGVLKPRLQGRADMGAVSGKIKQQLS